MLTTSALRQIAPLKTKSLRSQVATTLREAIFNGVFNPGDQLQETALAAQIGVSRSPLREALLVLEREGLVTITPNRGAFIRTMTPEEMAEVLSLRFPLETMALRLARQRITPQLLVQLRQSFEALCELAQKREARTLIEREFWFHKAIWAASGHKLLNQTLVRICTPWFAFVEIVHGPSKLDFSADAESHRVLIEYLNAKYGTSVS